MVAHVLQVIREVLRQDFQNDRIVLAIADFFLTELADQVADAVLEDRDVHRFHTGNRTKPRFTEFADQTFIKVQFTGVHAQHDRVTDLNFQLHRERLHCVFKLLATQAFVVNHHGDQVVEHVVETLAGSLKDVVGFLRLELMWFCTEVHSCTMDPVVV